MTWSLLLGALAGSAALAVMAPWWAGPPARSLRVAAQPDREQAPRSGRRRRGDALADDLAVQRSLEALARSVRAGRTLNQALDELAHRPAVPPGQRLLLDTLRLAATAGTGPAPVIERGAVVAADRVAARQERRAQAAQARLSATVLTWVPVGVAVLAVTTDVEVRRVALTTPLGWACLAVGGGLSAMGRRWIRRITEGPGT